MRLGQKTHAGEHPEHRLRRLSVAHLCAFTAAQREQRTGSHLLSPSANCCSRPLEQPFAPPVSSSVVTTRGREPDSLLIIYRCHPQHRTTSPPPRRHRSWSQCSCTAGAEHQLRHRRRRNTYDRCPTSPRYRASAGAGSAGRPRTRTGWTSHISSRGRPRRRTATWAAASCATRTAASRR